MVDVRRLVADDPDREEFPELVDAVGEDPARFLDHNFEGDHRTLVVARIRAIDQLGVVNAWIQIERELVRGPREPVIELLEQRREWILEHGGREDRLQDEDERTPAAPKDVVWLDEDGEPYERTSADAKLRERQAALRGTQSEDQLETDGGDPLCVAEQVRNPVSSFIVCPGCGDEFDPREIYRGNATAQGYCSLECFRKAQISEHIIWQSEPLRWLRRRLRGLHSWMEPDIIPFTERRGQE